MSTKLPQPVEDFRTDYADVWKAFTELGDHCHKAGPLDEKTRRLVKVALSIGAGLEGGPPPGTQPFSPRLKTKKKSGPPPYWALRLSAPPKHFNNSPIKKLLNKGEKRPSHLLKKKKKTQLKKKKKKPHPTHQATETDQSLKTMPWETAGAPGIPLLPKSRYC